MVEFHDSKFSQGRGRAAGWKFARGQVLVTAQQAWDFTDRLVGIGEKVRYLPADLARNHDHYLHGHAKK